jgi:hypothetical protein
MTPLGFCEDKVWSAAAKSAQRTTMPLWLGAERKWDLMYNSTRSKSAAVGGALQKRKSYGCCGR